MKKSLIIGLALVVFAGIGIWSFFSSTKPKATPQQQEESGAAADTFATPRERPDSADPKKETPKKETPTEYAEEDAKFEETDAQRKALQKEAAREKAAEAAEAAEPADGEVKLSKSEKALNRLAAKHRPKAESSPQQYIRICFRELPRDDSDRRATIIAQHKQAMVKRWKGTKAPGKLRFGTYHLDDGMVTREVVATFFFFRDMPRGYEKSEEAGAKAAAVGEYYKSLTCGGAVVVTAVALDPKEYVPATDSWQDW